jgi:hypothetical protein
MNKTEIIEQLFQARQTARSSMVFFRRSREIGRETGMDTLPKSEQRAILDAVEDRMIASGRAQGWDDILTWAKAQRG